MTLTTTLTSDANVHNAGQARLILHHSRIQHRKSTLALGQKGENLHWHICPCCPLASHLEQKPNYCINDRKSQAVLGFPYHKMHVRSVLVFPCVNYFLHHGIDDGWMERHQTTALSFLVWTWRAQYQRYHSG